MSHEIRLHHENSIEIANKIQHVINTKIIDEPRSPINIRGLNPELSFSPKKKISHPYGCPKWSICFDFPLGKCHHLDREAHPGDHAPIMRLVCGRRPWKNMLDQIMLHTSWRLDNTQRNKKSHSANPSFAFAFYHRKNASTSKIFKKKCRCSAFERPRADVAERYKKMINKNFGRGSPFTMPPETCFFRRSPFEQDICSTCIDLSDCKVKHRMTSRFPNLNQ